MELSAVFPPLHLKTFAFHGRRSAFRRACRWTQDRAAAVSAAAMPKQAAPSARSIQPFEYDLALPQSAAALAALSLLDRRRVL